MYVRRMFPWKPHEHIKRGFPNDTGGRGRDTSVMVGRLREHS